jgi:hypothetical protein
VLRRFGIRKAVRHPPGPPPISVAAVLAAREIDAGPERDDD